MGTHPEGESCDTRLLFVATKGSAHFPQALPELISFEAQ